MLQIGVMVCLRGFDCLIVWRLSVGAIIWFEAIPVQTLVSTRFGSSESSVLPHLFVCFCHSF